MGIIGRHFAPSISIVVSTIMYATPMPRLLSARISGDISKLNAWVFIGMWLTSTGWLAYAIQQRNPIVFFGNVTGSFVALWGLLIILPHTRERQRERLHAAFLATTALWLLFGAMRSFDWISAHALGIGHVVAVVIFYASPLTVIRQVFRTRSSKLLYWPLTLLMFINCTMWLLYGSYIQDITVWLPP